MSESNPTTSAVPGKPAKPQKPYPEYPLFAHAAGVWAKKIRGKLVYFGPWSDPDGALDNYNRQKDDLHAGRTPRTDPSAATVKDAVNSFLNHKDDKVKAGELSVRTWAKYKEVTDLLIGQLGKGRLVSDLRPDDFTRIKNHMTKTWGPLRVADFIQHVRSVFKHAYDSELIDRPVRFGPGFARPSQKVLRQHKAKQGAKLFSADEVRSLLKTADAQTKAIILLGINCGYGNADVAGLPLAVLDLAAGWIDYPRPKTGVARRSPLWPETVTALRDVLARRPAPRDETGAGLVFLSERGTPLVSLRVKESKKQGKVVDRTDGIAVRFGKLLRAQKINGRKGLGFYTLRHTFRTVADEARDQPAADHLMGHQAQHMSSVYRETIADSRLRAVADHVRSWLYPPDKPEQEPENKPATDTASAEGGAVS